MTESLERPRCPDCRMPHDLTPGSAPMNVCRSLLSRLAAEADAEHFSQWADELQQPPTA